MWWSKNINEVVVFSIFRWSWDYIFLMKAKKIWVVSTSTCTSKSNVNLGIVQQLRNQKRPQCNGGGGISIWPPNPLKQLKMWIFGKWKIIVFGQNHNIFLTKGGLKRCIIMYLGNIHSMSLVPVTFGNFFFQILQKWHFLGQIEKSQNNLDIFAQ